MARQDEGGNWVLLEPPPNKATELLKCQRYFQKYEAVRETVVRTNVETSYIDISFLFPVRMRAAPGYKLTSSTGVVDKVSLTNGAVKQDVGYSEFTRTTAERLAVSVIHPSTMQATDTFTATFGVELSAEL